MLCCFGTRAESWLDMFVKASVARGILPEILEELLAARKRWEGQLGCLAAALVWLRSVDPVVCLHTCWVIAVSAVLVWHTCWFVTGHVCEGQRSAWHPAGDIGRAAGSAQAVSFAG
jgi:hypothetical protein